MGQGIPNSELVVYVLSLLGGESKSVHTEDIALKCHELFSDSFSWTKYPDRPDKEVVRTGLMDARKEKHGQLVKGRSGREIHKVPDGWMLTEAGIEWLKKNHGIEVGGKLRCTRMDRVKGTTSPVVYKFHDFYRSSD